MRPTRPAQCLPRAQRSAPQRPAPCLRAPPTRPSCFVVALHDSVVTQSSNLSHNTLQCIATHIINPPSLQYDQLYCNTVSLSQPILSLQYNNCITIPFSVLLAASVYCNTLYQLPAPFISQYNQILQYNLGSSSTDSVPIFFFIIFFSHLFQPLETI